MKNIELLNNTLFPEFKGFKSFDFDLFGYMLHNICYLEIIDLHDTLTEHLT